MAFRVFTDACSNLPGNLLEELSISVLPCSYVLDGETVEYSGNISDFDYQTYYNALRSGKKVTTSLINSFTFMQGFQPALEEGSDIIYVGLSSGISGTIQAAKMAAEDLLEDYPDRTIRVIDSMGAGLGTGLVACRAGDLAKQGLTADVAADILETEVLNLCEYFIVDDLAFLAGTGRLSNAAAFIGNVLHIVPILRGDEEGHIVASGKYVGRKKAINVLLDTFRKKVVNPEGQRIAISHGDCEEDAKKIAEAVTEFCHPKELIICPHEPFTGAHVGPGMLALFFLGNGR